MVNLGALGLESSTMRASLSPIYPQLNSFCLLQPTWRLESLKWISTNDVYQSGEDPPRLARLLAARIPNSIIMFPAIAHDSLLLYVSMGVRHGIAWTARLRVTDG